MLELYRQYTRNAVEELIRLVAALRERVTEQGVALRGNEALTRYALVDPLLRGLGWDTEDPAQVVPEYGIPSSPARSADYALFIDSASAGGKAPAVIVEAKKLGTPLLDAAQQAVNYCTVDGFEYFVVTDGDDWQLFETLRRGNLDAKRIMRFRLLSDPTADVCRKALALWRQGFEDGAVGVAPPVLVEVDCGKDRDDTDDARDDDGWVPLSEFTPEAGTKPAGLRLPERGVVSVSSWKDVMIEVTKWVVTTGRLSATGEPLRVGKRYLVAPQPKHPDGKDFTAPGSAGALYVETHFSARNAIRHTRSIVGHAGVDAGLLAVQLAR